VVNDSFFNIEIEIWLIIRGEIIAKIPLKGAYLIHIWAGFQCSWFQNYLPLGAITVGGTFSLYKYLIDNVSFGELILRIAIGRTESDIGNNLANS